MVMGTASTMASMAEALGMTLPGNAAIPAPDSRRYAMAELAGRRAVEMAKAGGPKPSEILSAQAFDNAIRADMAIGGSTNAIIHLVAIAGRVGVHLPLTRFDELSRSTPLLTNVRPSGKYLMEDFFYAGGLRAFLTQLDGLIDFTQRTCNGRTLGENVEGAKVFNADVIRPLDNPVVAGDGLAVLKGNLAPGGAVIKPAAMEPQLRKHMGPAVVFKDYNDMAARIDDEFLPVTKDSVIVLQSAGPQGAPGMPEWGQLPIPKKLLKEGVRDMLRISDARMSGTSYGACVLHVTPESHVGGPLALVRDGDIIELDVDNRRIDMLVSDEELARRKAAWKQPAPKFTRGYGVLYLKHIQQADTGCDFDFLETEKAQAEQGGEPEIH
jgi:dihydroxy-acid dehydratase